MSGTVARRYSGALADVAEARGCLDEVARDLASFRDLLAGSPDLRSVLGSAGFTRDEHCAVLSAVLDRAGSHPLARGFLLCLARNGRMGAFDAILGALSERHDAIRGRVRAEVTSAAPLDAATIEGIRLLVGHLTSREHVDVETRVDPALLGGVVTRVGDTILDGSLRTRLHHLRTQLLARPLGDA